MLEIELTCTESKKTDDGAIKIYKSVHDKIVKSIVEDLSRCEKSGQRKGPLSIVPRPFAPVKQNYMKGGLING